MPRTGSSDRILPRPEGYLDSALRATSDLYPTLPPFDGLNALIMPKRLGLLLALCRTFGADLRKYRGIG